MNKEVLNPLFLTDFYKTLHHLIYVPGLQFLTSYWTPRKVISGKEKELGDKVVFFGLSAFIQEYLIDAFNKNFFKRDLNEIIEEYKDFISKTFSADVAEEVKFIEDLHKLGYLPIRIKALPEGTFTPIGCPMVEVTNTDPGFAWLVNYLETIFSCNMWLPSCAATIAMRYRMIADKYWTLTCDDGDPKTMCCDFAMRGMGSMEAAMKSASAHLLFFRGASTIPAYWYLEKYYGAKAEDIGRCSPSTEHSVMSSYGDSKEDEMRCYETILDKVPNGPLSIVSDTYDYWGFLTSQLPELKEKIMARNGKTLIRGDSGNPVDIICGEWVPVLSDMKEFAGLERAARHGELPASTLHDGSKYFRRGDYFKIKDQWYYYKFDNPQPLACDAETVPPQLRGTVEILYEIFGGRINSKGYKTLDPHIGAIYGEGITLERAEEIYLRLATRGYAANVVGLGIGSYTYQYNTRDTFGFALKASHAIIDGKPVKIYKNPKTDKNKLKKSHKGLVTVFRGPGDKIMWSDGILAMANIQDNMLVTVYDGKEGIFDNVLLSDIRSTAEYCLRKEEGKCQ